LVNKKPQTDQKLPGGGEEKKRKGKNPLLLWGVESNASTLAWLEINQKIQSKKVLVGWGEVTSDELKKNR